MGEPYYSFRPNSLSLEHSFRIVDQTIHCTSGRSTRVLPYSHVREACTVRRLARGDVTLKSRIVNSFILLGQRGERIKLSPIHYKGDRTWSDQSASYQAFVDSIVLGLKSNPKVVFRTRDSWRLRVRNAAMHALLPCLAWSGGAILRAVRWVGVDRASSIGGAVARVLGPSLPASRVANANLKTAFPERSNEEINQILLGVWDNFGRALAECAFVDELSTHDQTCHHENRIVLDDSTVQRGLRLAGNGPCLLFGAHLGSWELGSLAAAFGLRLAGVYRPFKHPALNDLLVRMRPGLRLIASRLGAATQIDDCCREGWSIGMLVDQHFSHGVEVLFFGRRCKVNPTLAKLARKFEYPIYGVRVIRKEGAHFLGELTASLEVPRDKDGKVDIQGTMQMITAILEHWIRENPDQWLWLHRRWR
jgi:Kdo2-lipid IVA lauroyltransferase/acyltransferase